MRRTAQVPRHAACAVVYVATPRCRVLVVDDEQDTAQTFAYLLVGMGHEATFLTDPQKVIEKIAQLKPHIVFLDINMPGLNGWEVAKLIRKDYPNDGEALKLVAVTGQTEQTAHEKSRKAGFDAHLLKPVSPDLAEAVVRQFFGGKCE
jgi:CheY-like chemotaxis protein